VKIIQGYGHGRRKDFFQGDSRGFFQNFFQGGLKVLKFGFYPSKLKKQPFFANNFKIQRGQGPPSDAHGYGAGAQIKIQKKPELDPQFS